jgi:hypothetical protein
MAFCTSCGSQMEGTFCTNCGAPAQAGSAQPAVPPPPVVSSGGMPPTKKKTSPVVWILGGCFGLVVLGFLVTAIAGYFFASKIKQVAENPAALVEMIARANPNVDVVSTDAGAGKITVRDKKTGKTVTLNFEDIKNGKFSFEGEDGEKVDINAQGNNGTVDIKGKDGTVHFGGGSAAEIPSWVPQYPGSSPQGAFSSKGDKGEGGAFGFVTKDPVEKVASFYAQALEGAGFKVERHSTKIDGKDSAIISAQKDTQQLSVGINTGDDGTNVGVNYTTK